VPWNYPLDNKLRDWVHTQRKAYNKGRLRRDRQLALEGLGFWWQAKDGAAAVKEMKEGGGSSALAGAPRRNKRMKPSTMAAAAHQLQNQSENKQQELLFGVQQLSPQHLHLQLQPPGYEEQQPQTEKQHHGDPDDDGTMAKYSYYT
jgi:Helicase associated domain